MQSDVAFAIHHSPINFQRKQIMQLRDIVTSPVETVGPESTLFDAAKTMLTRDLGWLPVTDQGEKVVGIITDRDITVRGVAGGLDAKKAKVEDVMSRDVFSCSIDSTVEEVCSMMEDEQVRRVVVVDEDEKLAGVVSLADLASQTRGSESGEVLKKVTEPS
jgi:CBS domain-containing protein